MSDQERLRAALELAAAGRGKTDPNPVVGAILVQGETTVGTGWHERAGGPHAEIVALTEAGPRARGATLYVTLEPCAHQGRTPPCADAIIEAGVARVVAAVGDPNPLTNGAGFERLRAAGIEVELPGGEAEWLAQGPEPGVPGVGLPGAAVRRLQGGGDARRAGHGARLALGDRGGEPAARARAARRRGRRGGRDGDRARRQSDADRPGRAGRAAAAAARVRPRAPARGLRARAPQRPHRRGAPASRRRGRALAAPRGRPDAGHRLRQGRPGRPARPVRGADARPGAGPHYLGELPEPIRLLHASGQPVGEDYLVTAYLREP